MAMSSTWEMQIGGRLLAGVGGVILNVLMSKMVTDWFADKEIATAMGIFVNSWPVGIALALVILPPIAEASNLTAALLFVTGWAVVGLLLLAVFYRSPKSTEAGSPAAKSNRCQLVRSDNRWINLGALQRFTRHDFWLWPGHAC
jgi:MFS family permease